MRFRLRHIALAGIILAFVIAYGYFSTPRDPGSSAHPPTSTIAIPNSLSIQGPYFSDQDRVDDRIIAAINYTHRSLDIAVYSITQPDITATIEAAHRRGVRIRIVSDAGQSLDRHSEVAYLRSSGIPVRLCGGYRGRRSLMHNKFAIFDGTGVETGSFNWTTSATSYNFENAIFIEDPKVAARYEREFGHIWALAR